MNKRSAPAAFSSPAAARDTRRRPNENDMHPAVFLPGLDELQQKDLKQHGPRQQEATMQDQKHSLPTRVGAVNESWQASREQPPPTKPTHESRSKPQPADVPFKEDNAEQLPSRVVDSDAAHARDEPELPHDSSDGSGSPPRHQPPRPAVVPQRPAPPRMSQKQAAWMKQYRMECDFKQDAMRLKMAREYAAAAKEGDEVLMQRLQQERQQTEASWKHEQKHREETGQMLWKQLCERERESRRQARAAAERQQDEDRRLAEQVEEQYRRQREQRRRETEERRRQEEEEWRRNRLRQQTEERRRQLEEEIRRLRQRQRELDEEVRRRREEWEASWRRAHDQRRPFHFSDNSFCPVLGVARNAPLRDVKKAYRAKALLLHPDRNPNDPLAKDRFQKLRDAYEKLLARHGVV